MTAKFTLTKSDLNSIFSPGGREGVSVSICLHLHLYQHHSYTEAVANTSAFPVKM